MLRLVAGCEVPRNAGAHAMLFEIKDTVGDVRYIACAEQDSYRVEKPPCEARGHSLLRQSRRRRKSIASRAQRMHILAESGDDRRTEPHVFGLSRGYGRDDRWRSIIPTSPHP